MHSKIDNNCALCSKRYIIEGKPPDPPGFGAVSSSSDVDRERITPDRREVIDQGQVDDHKQSGKFSVVSGCDGDKSSAHKSSYVLRPLRKEDYIVIIKNEDLSSKESNIKTVIKDFGKSFPMDCKIFKKVFSNQFSQRIVLFSEKYKRAFIKYLTGEEIPHSDLSRNCNVLLLDPPPEVDEERKIFMKDRLGINFIKYLFKLNSQFPYAILGQTDIDNASRRDSTSTGFCGFNITFAVFKNPIVEYILYQCRKCQEWGVRIR
ncbi:hypothetical protein ACOME3_006678 [Neoechinorhynchus agilis]